MQKLKLPRRYFKIGGPKPKHMSDKLYVELQRFDQHQKTHYASPPVACLCGSPQPGYEISRVDREGFEFPLVICEQCGLIRAEHYWDEAGVADYYANWYRKLYGDETLDDDPQPIFNDQIGMSVPFKKFVDEYVEPRISKNYVIADVGGAAGGVMSPYLDRAQCYLFDYNNRFLKFAKGQGIHAIHGGIPELVQSQIQPDLVILSHVIEHFRDANKEIENLTRCLKKGSLVYAALPALDSLRLGRREYNFLGDINKAHVFYFTSHVLNNFMERHGFKVLKSDTETKALYEYTGVPKPLVNHYNEVVDDLRTSELKRALGFTFLRSMSFKVLPVPLKNFLKKALSLKNVDSLVVDANKS